MADYVPFTTAQYPTRRPSLATGYDIGIQDLLLQQAQKQQMERAVIDAQQAQANLERYRGMTPGEISKSQWQGAQADAQRTTPGYLESLLRGDIADSDVRQSKARVDVGTEGARITSTNAKSRLDETKSILGHIDTYANIIAGAAAQSPILAQQAWSQMRNTLPQGLKEAFPETYSDQAATGLQRLREKLAYSAEHLSKMDIQAEELASRERIGRGHDDATRYAADRSVDRAAQSAQSRIPDVMTSIRLAKEPRDKYMKAREAAMNPNLSEADREMAKQIADMTYPLAREYYRQKGQELLHDGTIRQIPTPEIDNRRTRPGPYRTPGTPGGAASQGPGLRPGVTREQ